MTFVLPPVNSVFVQEGISDWNIELHSKIEKLTEIFQRVFEDRVKGLTLPASIVRGKLPCNVAYILDEANLWLVCDVALGLPYPRRFNVSGRTLTDDKIEQIGIRELQFRDPFYVKLSRTLLDTVLSDKSMSIDDALMSAVDALVSREYQRVETLNRRVRISPLFGDPPLESNPSLCFVIAPFSSGRTQIYTDYIKPIVERHDMACVRADDIRTNRGIVENIWRSICEARFLIADLTSANPNVFYELGIAHTVGKEVILIEERPIDSDPPKRPFDTMGINAIIYDNSAPGGHYLREELDKRIAALLTSTELPGKAGQNAQAELYADPGTVVLG